MSSPGSDPYAATAGLLDPRGRYAISDSAWAMHLLGLQQALPDSGYVSMTGALPMLRAVKDAEELQRLASAGAAADASFEQILGVRFAGRREDEIGADLAGFLRAHGHSEVDFTVVGSGPNGANPHHEMSDLGLAALFGALVAVFKRVGGRWTSVQMIMPVAAAFAVAAITFLLAGQCWVEADLRVMIAPLVTFLPGAAMRSEPSTSDRV